MPNELLKEEIRDIHPVLRLSISTLGVLDKGLTVVDASRVPSDYKRMGRHVKAFSLHYKQSNGYAHALDIRTIGHSEWRNFLIIQYFKVLGFNTLRHSVSGPSGDHLHVSLISHDRPRFY